jgi:FkbM family methyltransferase
MIGCSREHPNQKTTSNQKYLYQLINILREHDDALAALPTSLARQPEQVALPDWLTLAVIPPAPPPRRTRAAHVVWRLLGAVRHRMPDRLVDVLKRKRDQYAGSYIGYAVVGRGTLQSLRLSQRLLDDALADQRATKRLFSCIGDYAMHQLFRRSKEEYATAIVKQAVTSGRSLIDGLRDVAIVHRRYQSSPSFIEMRNFLRKEIDLPSDLASEIAGGGYTIIDIGAEPLSFEEHVYAPLLKRRPSVVIGFDPMDKEAPRTVDRGDVASAPGTSVRIFPDFVLDGNPATFFLNRMQATSSTLPANHSLARRFSLLSEALEAVETRTVPTRRLDDVLSAEDLAQGPIDFLKIDVQGATLTVLHSAEQTLAKTLVCHVEAEFSGLYQGEALFHDVDAHMRKAGFGLLDFATIGRQRYNAFDASAEHLFHTGRLLWADCIYVRHLDEPERLSLPELLKLAEIAHLLYGKYDVAAFALSEIDRRTGSSHVKTYAGLTCAP